MTGAAALEHCEDMLAWVFTSVAGSVLLLSQHYLEHCSGVRSSSSDDSKKDRGKVVVEQADRRWSVASIPIFRVLRNRSRFTQNFEGDFVFWNLVFHLTLYA